MPSPFPDHPQLQGNYAPLLMESDAPDLIVEGELPKSLNGAFFRTGPNPQFPPIGEYHWFSGDGMIHAFYIENGKASYKNRWVRTKKWRLENDAGRALFSAYTPSESDPSVRGVEIDGRANTNILPVAGRLLALESGHSPIEINPRDLTTRGQQNFNNGLVGPGTAHPKIDPETGETLFFAFNAKGHISADMSFHIVSRDGVVTRSDFFKAPYPALVHDFVTTRNYAVFPIMPLAGSMERIKNGGAAYAWEPEKGVHIGVLPRKGAIDDMRWFSGEHGYVYHIMNAYEDGEKLICDVFEFEEAPLFPRADGKKSDINKWVPQLYRWTFNLTGDSDGYAREKLDDLPSEFPRLDERYAGLPYRYGYFPFDTSGAIPTALFNGIARRDHLTGAVERYEAPAGCVMEEPVFAPRDDEAGEGKGYLFSLIYDRVSNTSSLGVFDAEHLSAGPIAKIRMDHRIPFGFHGNWVDGALLG